MAVYLIEINTETGGTRKISFISPEDVSLMRLVARGHSLAEIGNIVGYEKRTISYKLTKIRESLGVATREEALVYFVRKGWI